MGLTVVCLNRTKWLEDLLVKPMPSDRLSESDEKPTLRPKFVRRSASNLAGYDTSITTRNGGRGAELFRDGDLCRFAHHDRRGRR